MNREAWIGWGQLECDRPLGYTHRNHILIERIHIYHNILKFEIQNNSKYIVNQPNLFIVSKTFGEN